MNEALIRQCAEEACGPEWYGPRPNIMRGAGELAIRLYHARVVAPLVEVMRQIEIAGHGGFLTAELAGDMATKALAPFQQEAK